MVNPVLAVVTRGDMAESLHRGALGDRMPAPIYNVAGRRVGKIRARLEGD